MNSEEEVRFRDLMIEFDQIETTILHIVNTTKGIKGIELILRVMTVWSPREFNKEEYAKIIQSLVERAEIVELFYMVPKNNTTDVHLRSFYCPKGTTIVITTP